MSPESTSLSALINEIKKLFLLLRTALWIGAKPLSFGSLLGCGISDNLFFLKTFHLKFLYNL